MDFRLLGPLEVVERDRPLALGGAKQRALLAVLLLHANDVVSTERLIDLLWGESPPSTVAKSVQTYVSRLRKTLGTGRLLTRTPGYVLHVDPSELDLARFERLVAQARGTDPESAAQLLNEALALWRGPALADLAYEPFARAEIVRLEELRLAAVEQRIDSELAAGRHAEVAGELEALVLEHPLRERLRGQLMLCLYRAGRQAEALEAFRSARAVLVEELGIEPGRGLRELHEAILAQDPRLDLPVEAHVDRTPRGAFVGRERELAELVRGVEDAFAGRGSLFLLVGEPGVGKSRLAEELTARARARGARVLVGRCWEAGGAPAYWPWVQSLRPYLREADAEVIRSQLGQGAVDVARLHPELRERLGDLAPAPAIESEGARFRLFDSLTAFIKRMAAAQPLVVMLDDLHAADEPSLLLLRFVARELGDSRLMVVGAYRDVDPTLTEPLTTTVTELAREPVTRTLALSGLAASDVVRFIEAAAPGAPAAELGPSLHAETEGNPLFVGEMVRLLATEQRLREPGTGPLAVPQSVREVIGHRLRHLSSECDRLLSVASVMGREFDIDSLTAVIGLDRDAVLELLDEAIDTRVVSEVSGAIGRLRFAHALIRDAAYHRLPSGRRARLHRQVGEVLESLYASDLEAHLAELAHHFFESAAADGRGKAVDYARRAGARAVGLLAFEEAARLYQMALAALGADGTARVRCELLLALGNAQSRSGDAQAAKATFLRAAELGRAADLPELVARAAAGYGGRFLWTHAVADERIVPLLEDALSGLGEEHALLRVQLLSRLAAALRHSPSRERREDICSEALRLARRIGDPLTLANALAATAAATLAPHTAPARFAEAEEIVSAAARAGDQERLFDGHEHWFWAAWELGDPDRRAAELAAMVRLAGELRQPAQLWTVAAAETTLALSHGRFAEAAEQIEQAAAIGGRAVAWNALATRRIQLFMLRREQATLAGYEREIEDYPHEFPSPLMHGAILAHVYAHLQRAAEAETLVRELTARDLSNWHVDEEWLVSICLLAETCALLDDTDAAGPLYELLLPYGSQNAVALPELALDSVSRPLGTLANLQGRFDEATHHFQQALQMNHRMGARPFVARTHEEHARMLLRRNARGDRTQAEELLARARAIYRELGMQEAAKHTAAPTV